MFKTSLYKFIFSFIFMIEASSFTMPLTMQQMHQNKQPVQISSQQLRGTYFTRRNMLFKSLVIANIPFASTIAEAYQIDELNHMKIYDKTMQSVCYISTEYKNIAQKVNMDVKDVKNLPKGVGTGFVWDNVGHIVTNFHVINKVDNAQVTFTDAFGKKKVFMAKLTGVDPDRDIAVIKVDDANEFVPIPLSAEKNIKVGQYAYAIGNPFGQDHTFTMGIISGKNREISSPTGRKIKGIIQTDAAINPGNSGGPLLDSSAQLIGMNTATFGMGVSSGVNFAISVDMIKETVDEIIKYGSVRRAVIGISYLDRIPKESGLPEVTKGVIVLDVPLTSPAFTAGLIGIKNNNNTLGDVIVGINEDHIDSPNDMLAVLEKYKPGDTVVLHVLRNNTKSLDIIVTLGSFAVNTFSGLKTEKNNTDINAIEIDVPLDNIAPELKK